MNDEKKPAPPAGAPSAPSPEDATKEKAPELGYLELLRAPAEPDTEPDPTDRVLSRHRPSVWDF